MVIVLQQMLLNWEFLQTILEAVIMLYSLMMVRKPQLETNSQGETFESRDFINVVVQVTFVFIGK